MRISDLISDVCSSDLGIKPRTSIVSIFFIMTRHEPFHTDTHAMVFSDCGLVINPDEEELADIALAAAGSARQLLGIEPRAAMLSFSTHGSAHHSTVEKVAKATRRVQERDPDLLIAGEMQIHAGNVPQVAPPKR